MVNFKSKTVSVGELTVGEKLRTARKYKQVSLANIAKELNIAERYLAALEADQYRQLPAGIYAINYLREYALWLGLLPARLITQFEYDRRHFNGGRTDVFERQVVQRHLFLVVPKLLKTALLVLVGLLCLSYLAWLLTNIYLPPKLAVWSPASSIIVNEPRYLVSGQSEKESELLINGLPVVISIDGHFELWLDLKQGMNTISVTAQKKNKRKNIITREILYRKD